MSKFQHKQKPLEKQSRINGSVLRKFDGELICNGFCLVLPFEWDPKNGFPNHFFNYLIPSDLKLMNIHIFFGNYTSNNVPQRGVWREWFASGNWDWFLPREMLFSQAGGGVGCIARDEICLIQFDPQRYPQLFNNASNTIYQLPIFSATTFRIAENCDK